MQLLCIVIIRIASLIELENELYLAEKICAISSMRGLMAYPHAILNEATEDLLNSEFHDVLPGSSVQSGEESGLRYLFHGLKQAETAKTKGFFSLLKQESPAEPGSYPIFVFNPNPYKWETMVECEFMLSDQNWSLEQVACIDVYDSNGNLMVTQKVKEESTFSLDWRQRIVFSCQLAPLSMNRFSAYVKFLPPKDMCRTESLVYEDEKKYVEIDAHTGLLKSYCVNGKEYIRNGFCPILCEDNADPWGMDVTQDAHLGGLEEEFLLMTQPHGLFKSMKNIQIIEDGPLLRRIEAFFEKDNTKIRIEYTIYRQTVDLDVKVTVYFQEADKLLRLRIPTLIEGQLIGQTAFGTDTLFMNGKENVSHRFLAMRDGKNCLAIINNCQYASCYVDGNLYLSLLRGAGYCCHPISNRPLLPKDRYINRLDQREHTFNFRVTVAKEHELERLAMEFNQPAFAVNAFPVSSEYDAAVPMNMTVEVNNCNVVMTCLKQSVDGQRYIIRLFNNSSSDVKAELKVAQASLELSFSSYEVITAAYDGELSICAQMDI